MHVNYIHSELLLVRKPDKNKKTKNQTKNFKTGDTLKRPDCSFLVFNETIPGYDDHGYNELTVIANEFDILVRFSIFLL
jgi:hypothetical protein